MPILFKQVEVGHDVLYNPEHRAWRLLTNHHFLENTSRITTGDINIINYLQTMSVVYHFSVRRKSRQNGRKNQECLSKKKTTPVYNAVLSTYILQNCPNKVICSNFPPLKL